MHVASATPKTTSPPPIPFVAHLTYNTVHTTLDIIQERQDMQQRNSGAQGFEMPM